MKAIKEFLRPTKTKILYLIILLLFFPSFYVGIGFGGFTSLAWMIIVYNNSDAFILSSFLFLAQSILQCYLIACIIYKFIKNKLLISILLLFLVLLTIFLPIYYIADVGGGKERSSLLETFKQEKARDEDRKRLNQKAPVVRTSQGRC